MPCWLTRAFLVVALTAAALAVPAGSAWAEKQDARKHYDQATAAFGLGRYADAAAEYEAAFRLRPDPAFLYNCAQSYRLAGNKARAVELYRNYVRLYGDSSNADDARKHLSDLELEVAAERVTAPRAPVAAAVVVPAAVVPPPAPVVPAPGDRARFATVPSPIAAGTTSTAPPPPSRPPEVHVDAPSNQPVDGSDGGQRSVASQPWFWVAIGAVVVAGTVAAVLATGGDKDPKATLGVVVGN